MKIIILAGGFGSRLSEETIIRPKPMIEIGDKPILWHIMKIYSHYGFNDFIILLGYKGYYIKEYFSNYFLHKSDVTIDIKKNKIEIINNTIEPWKITLIDTGINTMTGGRIKRLENYINDETFMLTYGDGLADINITELLKYHKNHKKLVTITAVQPEGRFGALEINDNGKVIDFIEKPKGDKSWINGGFFICNKGVFDFIKDDTIKFEEEPLEKLSETGLLYSYKHRGFWKCMDTLRDKELLDKLWQTGNAPWKVW